MRSKYLFFLVGISTSSLCTHTQARRPHCSSVAFGPRSKALEHSPRKTHQIIRGGSSYNEDDYYSRRNPNNGYPPPRRSETDEPYGNDYYGREENQHPEDDIYYERDYDDRGVDPSPTTSRAAESLKNMSKLIQNGNRKIGLPLLAAGAVFTLLGVSLFFNKSLLRLGNLCWIAGIPITIGPGRTAGYFFQPKKSRATACLAMGILLVLIGWPVFGMALEIFGLLNLFGNMFPIVTAMLKQMPVIGPLLKGNGGGGGGGRRRREDDYYDRDQYYDDGASRGGYERDQLEDRSYY